MIPNYGMYPQQMQRLNYLEQQMQNTQMPQSVQVLKGRPVTSIEEVRAIPIDFDGSTFYFPDSANNRIFSKQIGLNGQAIVRMYEITDLPVQQPMTTDTTKFVSQDEFNSTIKQLMEQLEQIKQGGVETNANAANGTIF